VAVAIHQSMEVQCTPTLHSICELNRSALLLRRCTCIIDEQEEEESVVAEMDKAVTIIM